MSMAIVAIPVAPPLKLLFDLCSCNLSIRPITVDLSDATWVVLVFACVELECDDVVLFPKRFVTGFCYGTCTMPHDSSSHDLRHSDNVRTLQDFTAVVSVASVTQNGVHTLHGNVRRRTVCKRCRART